MRPIITLAASAMAMFLLGSIYAYGVLLPALMAAFGWERSTAALPHAVLLFVYAVGMGIGGILEHRLRAQISAAVGGALFGAGLWLAAQLPSLSGLVLAYGVLSGLGFGFTYVAAVTTAMRALPLRRGLAAGVVVGAFGLGAFVWAPLAQRLLPPLGWDGIFSRFGLLALILIPLLSLGIRAPRWSVVHATVARGMTLAQALRTAPFWLLFAAYTLATAVGLLLLAHLVTYGISLGIAPAQAAWLLSVMSVGSAIGRVGLGWLSDRIGRLACLIGASAFEVVLLLALAYLPQPAVLYAIAALTGLVFGTWLTLYGPTATDLFGLRYGGAIYGALYLSYGLGGLLGPTLGGLLADRTGSYRAAFLVSAFFCAVAAALYYAVLRTHHVEFVHRPALDEEFPEAA